MAHRTALFTNGASHEADELRQLIVATLDPGVPSAGDFSVTPRGLGANMSVDVSSGRVAVQGPSDNLYLVWSDATENLTIDAPPPSGQQRIDSVQVRIVDAGDGSGYSETRVVKGTSAASPSAPSVAANSVEIARVTLSSSTASITSGLITDRRNSGLPAPYWPAAPATGSTGALVTLPGGKLAVHTGSKWVEHDPLNQPWMETVGSDTFRRGVGGPPTATYTEIHRRNLPAGQAWRIQASVTSTLRPAFSATTIGSIMIRAGGTGLPTVVSRPSSGTAAPFDDRTLATQLQTTLSASTLMWVDLAVEVAGAGADFDDTTLSILAFPG